MSQHQFTKDNLHLQNQNDNSLPLPEQNSISFNKDGDFITEEDILLHEKSKALQSMRQAQKQIGFKPSLNFLPNLPKRTRIESYIQDQQNYEQNDFGNRSQIENQHQIQNSDIDQHQKQDQNKSNSNYNQQEKSQCDQQDQQYEYEKQDLYEDEMNYQQLLIDDSISNMDPNQQNHQKQEKQFMKIYPIKPENYHDNNIEENLNEQIEHNNTTFNKYYGKPIIKNVQMTKSVLNDYQPQDIQTGTPKFDPDISSSDQPHQSESNQPKFIQQSNNNYLTKIQIQSFSLPLLNSKQNIQEKQNKIKPILLTQRQKSNRQQLKHKFVETNKKNHQNPKKASQYFAQLLKNSRQRSQGQRSYSNKKQQKKQSQISRSSSPLSQTSQYKRNSPKNNEKKRVSPPKSLNRINSQKNLFTLSNKKLSNDSPQRLAEPQIEHSEGSICRCQGDPKLRKEFRSKSKQRRIQQKEKLTKYAIQYDKKYSKKSISNKSDSDNESLKDSKIYFEQKIKNQKNKSSAKSINNGQKKRQQYKESQRIKIKQQIKKSGQKQIKQTRKQILINTNIQRLFEPINYRQVQNKKNEQKEQQIIGKKQQQQIKQIKQDYKPILLLNTSMLLLESQDNEVHIDNNISPNNLMMNNMTIHPSLQYSNTINELNQIQESMLISIQFNVQFINTIKQMLPLAKQQKNIDKLNKLKQQINLQLNKNNQLISKYQLYSNQTNKSQWIQHKIQINLQLGQYLQEINTQLLNIQIKRQTQISPNKAGKSPNKISPVKKQIKQISPQQNISPQQKPLNKLNKIKKQMTKQQTQQQQLILKYQQNKQNYINLNNTYIVNDKSLNFTIQPQYQQQSSNKQSSNKNSSNKQSSNKQSSNKQSSNKNSLNKLSNKQLSNINQLNKQSSKKKSPTITTNYKTKNKQKTPLKSPLTKSQQKLQVINGERIKNKRKIQFQQNQNLTQQKLSKKIKSTANACQKANNIIITLIQNAQNQQLLNNLIQLYDYIDDITQGIKIAKCQRRVMGRNLKKAKNHLLFMKIASDSSDKLFKNVSQQFIAQDQISQQQKNIIKFFLNQFKSTEQEKDRRKRQLIFQDLIKQYQQELNNTNKEIKSVNSQDSNSQSNYSSMRQIKKQLNYEQNILQPITNKQMNQQKIMMTNKSNSKNKPFIDERFSTIGHNKTLIDHQTSKQLLKDYNLQSSYPRNSDHRNSNPRNSDRINSDCINSGNINNRKQDMKQKQIKQVKKFIQSPQPDMINKKQLQRLLGLNESILQQKDKQGLLKISQNSKYYSVNKSKFSQRNNTSPNSRQYYSLISNTKYQSNNQTIKVNEVILLLNHLNNIIQNKQNHSNKQILNSLTKYIQSLQLTQQSQYALIQSFQNIFSTISILKKNQIIYNTQISKNIPNISLKTHEIQSIDNYQQDFCQILLNSIPQFDQLIQIIKIRSNNNSDASTLLTQYRMQLILSYMTICLQYYYFQVPERIKLIKEKDNQIKQIFFQQGVISSEAFNIQLDAFLQSFINFKGFKPTGLR